MRVCVLFTDAAGKAGVRPRPESQETCHNAVMDCSPGRGVSGIGDFLCISPYLFRAPALQTIPGASPPGTASPDTVRAQGQQIQKQVQQQVEGLMQQARPMPEDGK